MDTRPTHQLTPEADSARWRELLARIATLESKTSRAIQYGAVSAPWSGSPPYYQTIQSGGSLAAAPAANQAAGTVTNSTFTMTVPGSRNLNVLYMVHATGKSSGAGGQLSYVNGNIVTLSVTANIKFDKNNTGLVPGFMWYYSPTGIAPGTYTVRLEAAVDAGQTLYLDQWFHQIWLLGAL